MITITPPDQGEEGSPPSSLAGGPARPAFGHGSRAPGSERASRPPAAGDNMEGEDSERRPHFPQFSYSASGTA